MPIMMIARKQMITTFSGFSQCKAIDVTDSKWGLRTRQKVFSVVIKMNF
jgi:hypothetical protein